MINCQFLGGQVLPDKIALRKVQTVDLVLQYWHNKMRFPRVRREFFI